MLSLLRLHDGFNFEMPQKLHARFDLYTRQIRSVLCTQFLAKHRISPNSGSSQKVRYQKMRTVLFVAALLLSALTFLSIRNVDSATTARSAAELWSKNCQSCHGKDGRAKTFKAKFNHARDLTDGNWHSDVSDERIFNSINNGRGKNMPAYNKKMTEQEIESLVSYVRAMRR